MLFEGYLPCLDHVRRQLRRLPIIRSEGGAVAVEFAMIALPFVFAVFSVLELALILLVYSTLENAMGDAARTIRTGSLQNSAGTKESFVTSICNNLGWLQTDCQAKLQVDVRTLSQLNIGNTAPDPYATGTFDSTKTTFSPGTQGSIMLVRAWYPWPLVLPSMNAALSRRNDGTALIQATTSFKNEPY